MATNPTVARLQARLAALGLAARALRVAALLRARRLRRRLRRLARAGLLPALAAAMAGAPLGAQPAVLPPVQRVAPVTLDGVGRNRSPDVAVRSSGEIVTVWSDITPPPPVVLGLGAPVGPAAEPTDVGVLFQRAQPDGTPVGAIGLVTSDRGSAPAVAVDEGGAFVVAWAHESDVRYRSFAPDGAPRTGVRPAAAQSSGDQYAPDVALDGDGDFVITWQGPVREGPVQLFARRFGPDGAARGDEVLVASVVGTPTFALPSIPSSAVAMADGAPGEAAPFVVAWAERGTRSAVRARLYGPGATLPLRDIVLTSVESANETNIVYSVDVAMDADGDFVVAWLDPDADTITAQRFDATGSAEPGRITIFDAGDATDVRPRAPAVAMGAAGDFVVSWHDVFADRIFSQRYTRDGAGEAAPSSFAVGSVEVEGPAVAMDADGEFVVAWRDGFDDARVRTASHLRAAVLAEQSERSTVVWENGETDEVAVALRLRPTAPVTVTLSPDSAQVDLGAGPGQPRQLRFEPSSEGPAFDIITVAAVDDSAAEGLHTAEVTLGVEGPGSIYGVPPVLFFVDGAPADRFTVQILDDDSASYSIATSTAGTNEGHGEPVTFTIFRGGDRGGENTVGYSFGGTASFGGDYTIVGGSAGASGARGAITFAPGETQKTIVVAIVDDAISEPNKSIELRIEGPLPEQSGGVSVPVAVVTLGDDDLAEVRVRQTGGGTQVVRDGPGDELSVALRSVPGAPVTVTLTPTSSQLNLGAGWGAPLSLTFPADAGALAPQTVQVHTAGWDGEIADAAPRQTFALRLASSSGDPGYDRGARFTVDGADRAEVAVVLVVPRGAGPGISDLYLPLITR